MTLPLDYPNERECRWLIGQGIDPTDIKAANVTVTGGTFDFADDGERVLIFTEPHDLVAWQPKRGALASWRGVAFALNEDAAFNPASWFAGSALAVHQSPLDWLLADGDGICIVKPALTYAMLRHVPRLVFSDLAYARKVRAWMQTPKVRCEFLIDAEARAA